MANGKIGEFADTWVPQVKFNKLKKGKYINEKGKTKKSSSVNTYNHQYFEPEKFSKGRVSRACAYFFLIYDNVADNVIDIDIMKNWCIQNRPNKSEIKRNYFIFQVQKTVNPFIIYPELINHIFNEKHITKVNPTKEKYKSLIKFSLESINEQIPELDENLIKYNSLLETTEEIIESSFLIIQIEKLKSSIKNLIHNLD